MCDKKNKVLFTDTECLVLSLNFKLSDENQVLLRVPRQNNMYSFNLENIVPTGGLACLIAKATVDESNKWFSWVFFLRTKDETSGILKDFIRQIENQLNQTDKTIRCDNGIEFKNSDISEFYGSKGINREYNNARTPQQNEVAKRKNRTLIEATRTMLANLFLPNTFWVDAVSTACYVLNRVLVTKPQNKTPYELITGKIPIISYIRPFGYHVTILNTIDHLGKFEEKSDEGFLVGYSLNSKAFRVYNLETNRAEENLHINFLETKPNVAGKGPNWLFDLDYLTDSMNYQPVTAENKANKTTVQKKLIIVQPNGDTSPKTNEEPKGQEYQAFLEELERLKRQEKEANDAAEVFSTNSTNTVNTVSTPISTANPSNVFSAVADFPNLETTVNVSPIPTSRIHSIHPTTQILGDPTSPIEPKKISQALEDESWREIGTKWVYRNKNDERGVVVRNKERIEAIRIFLAFASYMGFIVYQMDVKSAFLCGTIDEEVYVSEPPGFVDLRFPKKSGYRRGTIDKTLFIKKDKNDIMLFLQNILNLYFEHFKLPEDVVNRILQVVLDLQHFKSSLFIFSATNLPSSSAIHHISNIDNYVHQIIKFQSILITSRLAILWHLAK
ncbi:putative ribonuclease H-like domain-containing protein [Tanacetum coccineum]